MKSIDDYAKEWERNAESDPYWAILTCDQKINREWDVDEFFETGHKEIDVLLKYASKWKIPLKKMGTALDFGCGVGRLSKALKVHFQEVIGLDISKTMIEEAKRHSSEVQYYHNMRDDLRIIPDSSVDFIYSNIVLQHIHPRFQRSYLREFARILRKDGVAILQIPSQRRMRGVLDFVKIVLNRMLTAKMKIFLLKVLKRGNQYQKDFCIEMNCMKEKRVLSIAKESGMALLHQSHTNSTDPNFAGNLKFLTPEEALVRTAITPFISNMYFFQKL